MIINVIINDSRVLLKKDNTGWYEARFNDYPALLIRDKSIKSILEKCQDALDHIVKHTRETSDSDYLIGS